MRCALLLLLAIGLVGCKESDPVAVGTKTSDSGPSITKEDSPAKVASTTDIEPAKPTPAPEEKASSEKDPNENPKRLYQLKDLKTATITVGKHKLKVWLMDDNSKRQEGMMFLTDKEVKTEEGMLFVFPDNDHRSFWMRNTLIPLDLAYIRPDGIVANTVAMKALDETGRESDGKAQFVLEMKEGAFKRYGIKKGSKIVIPKGVKALE